MNSIENGIGEPAHKPSLYSFFNFRPYFRILSNFNHCWFNYIKKIYSKPFNLHFIIGSSLHHLCFSRCKKSKLHSSFCSLVRVSWKTSAPGLALIFPALNSWRRLEASFIHSCSRFFSSSTSSSSTRDLIKTARSLKGRCFACCWHFSNAVGMIFLLLFLFLCWLSQYYFYSIT